MDRIWLRARPGDPIESLPVTRVIGERQVRRALLRVAEFFALLILVSGTSGAVMMVALISGGF